MAKLTKAEIRAEYIRQAVEWVECINRWCEAHKDACEDCRLFADSAKLARCDGGPKREADVEEITVAQLISLHARRKVRVLLAEYGIREEETPIENGDDVHSNPIDTRDLEGSEG